MPGRPAEPRRARHAAYARHATHYLRLVERDEEDWRTIEQQLGQVLRAWDFAQSDPRLEVQFTLAMRLFCSRRGLWQRYADRAQRALRAARLLGRDGDEAQLLLSVGQAFEELGDRAEAVRRYRRVLRLSIHKEGAEWGEWRGFALNNIGLAKKVAGDLRGALRQFERARPLFAAAGNREAKAVVLLNVGSVHQLRVGGARNALDWLERALTIFQQENDTRGEATALNHIGAVHELLGHMERALEAYRHALERNERVGDLGGQASSLNNIGGVHEHRGDHQLAIECYERALAL